MKIYQNNRISFLFNNYDNRYLPSRYKEGHVYTVTEGECKSDVIMDELNVLNENKECLVPGYYINNDKVNIEYMNCSNRIEIEKNQADKKMNIYKS